jgi:hypothetical protein
VTNLTNLFFEVMLGLLRLILQILELLPDFISTFELDPLDDRHLLLQMVHRRVGSLPRLSDDRVSVFVFAFDIL